MSDFGQKIVDPYEFIEGEGTGGEPPRLYLFEGGLRTKEEILEAQNWMNGEEWLQEPLFELEEVDQQKPEMTSQERAIIITWLLAMGESMHLDDVCRLTGLKSRGARKLMTRVCRIAPVSKVGSYWRRLD